MSKLLRITTLILFIFNGLNIVRATHIMGGEITWKCEANGQYTIQLKTYRDCSSGNSTAGPGQFLRIHNYPNPGNVTNLPYTIIDDGDISPQCGNSTQSISCANRDPDAVYEYIGQVTRTLNGTPPPEGWIITYDDGNRNQNDNLVNSRFEPITLRAIIYPHSGSVAGQCVDNSPIFRETATSLLCVGQAFTYNHNATDEELDSLVYEWGHPLDGMTGTTVFKRDNPNRYPPRLPFIGGYSFNSPFPGQLQDSRNIPAQLNSQTGEISMTSYTSGKYVSCVKVSAYKCGEKVAEIYRELQSNISANCSVNEPPVLRPPFQDNNGNFTRYQDTVRAGDLVTFNLQITDFPGPNNPNSDSVFVYASGLQWGANFTDPNTGCANPPCATLSRPLPDSNLFAPLNNTFTWQTDCNHVSFTDGCVSLENTYNFVFRANDDACPIPGQTIATVSITVLADSVIESPLLNCIDVQANGDVQLDWNTTPDPNNSFTAWMIYSATNFNGPYTVVDSIKTYNQTSYTHNGANANAQRRWYYIRSRSGCKGIVQNVAKDTVSTIFLQPKLDPTCVGISWNSLSNPNPLGSANSYRIYKEYPIGSGMNFLQTSATTAFCDNFSVCEDTVAYRIELVNNTEGCVSQSNVLGFRFNRKPQTNFTIPGNTCSGPITFTNLTTAQGGNLSYVWNFGDGSANSTLTSPSHTFSGIGPFTVTLTASSGVGCDSTYSQLVTLGPDVDAGPDVAICPGGSVAIGGSPTTTALNASFQWSPASSLTNSSSANPVASPNSTIVYTVTVTDINGCTNTDQVQVSVNSLPTANAGTDKTICEGSNVTLGGAPTGPAGATYLWDNAGTLNNSTDANPIASPTITTIYTVTVSNGVNCTATDQVTVVVNPQPSADAGQDQSICPGASIQIGGSPTSSTPGALYTWSNGASLSNAAVANPIATPLVTTSYTVTVTHPNGCTNTDQVTVQLNSTPIADAGANKFICVGESTRIGGSPTGIPGSSYSWSNAATLDNANAANPLANPTSTTTYTVTVTDANGCTSSDQVVVNVNALPNADAGIDQSACPGESITLGGSNIDPVGTSYSWSPSTNLSNPSVKNPTLVVLSSQVYSVTVTAPGTACTAVDQVTVTAFPAVLPDAGVDQTICLGESIQIGGNSSGGTGLLSYSWNNVASLSDPSAQNPIATPNVTTTYTLTVTDQNNCTATDQVTVNVNANPTADAGVDKTICEGLSTNIGGSPTGPVGSTFLWDNGGSLSSTSTPNPIATPSSTTTYNVTVTSGLNCTSVDQVTVVVNPKPSADAGPNQTICDGGSVVIGGTPTSTSMGANYQWSNGATLDDATSSNPTAAPLSTTVYTVTVTDLNGCSSTDQMTVSVNPVTQVDAGLDVSICNGGSTIIGGTPTGAIGSSFLWDNATSLSNNNIANPIASPTVTTTYTVTVTDANNCTGTDQVVVSVGSLPTADAGIDQTICEGENVNLGGMPTGPLGATYQWSNGATLDDATASNPIANPISNTTYTVTVTDGSGCSNTDQVTINVLPSPNVDAGTDKTICDGRSIQIGGLPTSTTAGATYLWNNVASLNDATVANPIASPNVTTTYTVTVTHPNGCTVTDDIIVNVNTLPIADAGLDQIICEGETVQIGATSIAGNTYAWSNGGSLSNSSISDPIASPTSTTSYTLTVTNAAGCTSTDIVVVNVNLAPDADAGVDQTICEGETIQIGGTPTSSVAGASFLWDNGTSLSSDSDPNPMASPITTTTYSVTVTDGNGCSKIDQVTITVNSLPIADAGPNQFICDGGSVILGGAPTGPAGATYLWDNAVTLSSNTDANPTANPTVTTSYSVTVTDLNGCSSVDQMLLTVGSLPSVDAGLDQTICEGESVTIGGSPAGPAGSTFQWSNSATLDNASSSNPLATPLATTTYTVTVTDPSGCTNTDQLTINVLPIPAVDAGLDQTICNGGSVSIGGSPTSTTVGVSYLWSNATSLDDASVSNPVANPNITTTYTVTVTHPNGCTATDDVTINVNALPIVDAGLDQTICAGTTAIIGGSPTGPSGSTYLWDNAASLSSSSAANPIASPLLTTTYSVTVTDLNGCTAIDQVQLIVEPFPSVDAGANQTICEGESIAIGGSPTSTTVGASYLWDNATSLDDATLANPTASPIVTTVYTVTVTGANGCTITDNMTVAVNPAPVVDAGVDRDICFGESTNLGGSPTGPAASNYLWDNASTLNDATVANPTASPSVTTTYTVTVTDVNGCTNTDQLIVTVNSLPIADAGLDQTICSGQSATLGGSPTGPAGAIFIWDNAASLSNPNVSNPVATPLSTTTYSVTVTDGATMCSEVDQITITVNPLPNVDAGPDQTICNQQAIIIGGSPTSSTINAIYLWDNAGSLDDATLSNPTASPTTTTTYTVTVTHPNGCTDTDQMIVNVNSLPLADAGADQIICNGSSTTIGGSPTGPAGASYLWDNAISLNDNTIANPSATPLTTTTYSVTVTDGNGCTNVDQVLVTVIPVPDADAGLDQTICLNESVSIGGSPTSTTTGATFLWDNAASLDDATSSNPIASPMTTTTYSVTVTHPNGCTSTDQMVVNVNLLPTADAGIDQSICIGNMAVIGGSPTGPGGATYLWNNASSLNDPTSANPTASPTVTTTYTVTVTDGVTACTNTDQITLTVNPLPSVDAGLDQIICNGNSATLGGSPTGPAGSTYLWDNVISLNNPTDANPIATPVVTTTYTVTVTDVNGCINTDQITITVNPLPDVDAGSDKTICLNNSVTIGGSPTSLSPSATYLWDNAGSLDDATSANPIASPLSTTTYTVIVTHSNGCTDSDQMTVTVNPLPIADAGVDRDICVGSTTVIGGSPTGPVGASYTWDNAASLNNAGIANPVASPIVTTTYTVTVTDGNGCSNTDQVTIVVNPLPIADAGLDQTICEFDTVVIGSVNNPNLTYAWDNVTSLKDATVANPEAFPSTTTTYTVTVTDGNACTNTDQVTITVLPAPFVNPGSSSIICVGESVTLGGSPTGPVGATFAWDNTASLSSPNASNPIAVPTVTTIYTVTVTGQNGCTNSASVTITVNPLPVVDAGSDVSICEGSSTTIGGSPTGPIGSTYLWDNSNSLDDHTIPNPLASPTASTTYTVTVTDPNGCENSSSITVTVLPAPLVDAGPDQTICRTDSVEIGGVPTGPSGVSYAWSPNIGLSDATIANPKASPVDTTTYTVTITDADGCISSDQVTVNVNPLPLVDFKVDQTCISDLAAFTDLSTINVGAIASWEWDFGDGQGSSALQNPAYQYTNAGTYNVKLILTSGLGCKDSVEKSVVINPLPVADAGPDLSLCEGDEIQLGGNPTGPVNATYSWSPGGDLNNVSISNPTARPLNSTRYFLTVTDANGCYNYDTVDVTVNPLPSVDAGLNDTVYACSFTNVALNATGAIQYRWSPSTYLDNPFISSPTSFVEKSITYVVEGTDANGCINTDTIHLDVMNVDFLQTKTSICFGDSVLLTPELDGDTTGISYHWSPSFGLNENDVLTPLASPPIDQWYQVTIRNAAGCVDVDSVFVEVDENANVSFEYVNSVRCSGSALEIENTSTNTENFLWKVNGIARSNEFNPELGINYGDTNYISLLGWNQLCSDSVQIKIDPSTFDEVLQFKGTNVFTPNNDGINDIFDPGFEGEFIGCADFRIYDRWGEKVFDSNIGQYGWDGRTLRGRMAPEGVYYYVIIIAEREIKGSIYLSR